MINYIDKFELEYMPDINLLEINSNVPYCAPPVAFCIAFVAIAVGAAVVDIAAIIHGTTLIAVTQIWVS